MNILLDKLPNTVEIDGDKYEIDTDYTTSIRFEMLMLNNEIDRNLKIGLALNLYYDELPKNTLEAFNKICWFYNQEQTYKTDENSPKAKKRVYSFEHDSEYIYSAFLSDYGIDLINTDLHWWKFKALFKALKEDNTICKIMRYRAMDISKLKGEERKYYQKMQKLYAIPLPKEEQEKLDEINKILLNGGDFKTNSII